MTYNLLYKAQGTPPRAENYNKPETDIANLFDNSGKGLYDWPLAYILENKYADNDLKIDRLKGKDRARALHLQRACKKHGLTVFLANMLYEVSGSCERLGYDDYYYDHYNHHRYGYDAGSDDEHHSIIEDEDTERSLTLTKMVRPDGSLCAKDIPFEEESILQPQPFAEREPNEEGYDDGSTIHQYRDSCIVIMLDDEMALDELSLKTAFSSPKNAEALLSSFIADLRKAKHSPADGSSNSSIERCQQRISKFCTRYATNPVHSWGSNILYEFALATELLDRPDLFETAVSNGTLGFHSGTYRNLGHSFARGRLELIKWQRGVILALKNSAKRVSDVWANLSAMREGFEYCIKEEPTAAKVSLDAFNDWVGEALKDILIDLTSAETVDIDTIMKLAQEVKNPQQFLLSAVLPYVKRNITNRDFVLRFLRALYHSAQAEDIAMAVAISCYRDILSDMGPELLKPCPAYSTKSAYGTYHPGWYSSTDQHGKGTGVDPQSLATLCSHSLGLGLRQETYRILQDIVTESTKCDLDSVKKIWMPFLRLFLPHANASLDYESNTYGCRFAYQGIIDNYTRRYLIKQPPQPIITVPLRLGCGCGPCNELDRFLVDPKREVAHLKYAVKTRKHLESRIGRYYQTDTVNTTSPLTLVVRKDPNMFQAIAKMEDFKQRRAQVTSDILAIGIDELNKLLGTKGRELIDFDAPMKTAAVAQGLRPMPLADVPEHRSADMANKPQLEIIDLTK